MFECHACFRRYVRALISASLPERLATRARIGQSTRKAFQSTHAAAREEGGAGVQDLTNPSDQPSRSRDERYRASDPSSTPKRKFPDQNKRNWRDAPQYSPQKARARVALSKLNNSASVIQKPTQSKRLLLGNITTELKYLKDPLKLADHIQYVLKQGDGDKALALVRMSSKQLANTVSWNHVIDWHMQQQKTRVAMETYNEMKKRGQKPDSHTYLLLLRGLADNAYKNAHGTHILGKALSIYHSMSAPNAKVAPSIIHTNAMLKVCARAGDMDSMWDIASKLPEHGPHAADSRTFTTILNNLRMQALISPPNGADAEVVARYREETILQARQMWVPIRNRWRQGDLMLDEELVCAMGRLLLIGARPRDWDDVLSLVQQAMNIPRLVPRLGSTSREEANLPRIRAPTTPKSMKNDASEIVDEHDDPRPGAEFDAFDSDVPHTIGGGGSITSLQPSTSRFSTDRHHQRKPTRRGDGPAGYAQLSNSSLSLIVEACLKLVAKQPALDYWSLLTDPNTYAITPDSDNIHMLLRVLRQSRSSSEAADILCMEMPRLRLRLMPKTFRIAMSTCLRDARNAHAMDSAGRILDAMRSNLTDPDAKTLTLYFDIARDAGDAVRVARALERADDVVNNLRSHVSFKEQLSDEERDDSLAALRAMIGCYDRLFYLDDVANAKPAKGSVVLDKVARAKFVEKYRSLSAFVQRRVGLAGRRG